MILLTHLSQLDAATKRAIEVQPALRIIEFGVYEVQSSKGFWYRVTCRKNELGQRIAFCSCEDRFRRKSNSPCYHLAVAVGAHILLATAKAAVVKGTQITYE